MFRKVQVAGLAIALGCVAVPAFAATIDDELAALLREAPNDQVISALVFLEDRVDVNELDRQLTAQRTPRQARHEIVVRSLQEKADAAQRELLTYLTSRKAAGTVKDFTPFWIDNSIAVEALPVEIRTIAGRDDVRILFYNYEIELIKPVGNPGLLPEPGGGTNAGDTTIGLEAIRAPEVWDLGFTGEGILVATLDTGVDGNHPALASRWRGLDPRYQNNPEWAWFDPVTNTTFPQSFGSHGTHTMGTVCGGPPGEHIGVAPGAQWMHAAVIDRVNIPRTVADAKLSFEWMLDPDGDPQTVWDVPNVCSNSWRVTSGHGYPPCDETFWEHLDNCEAAGIIILFSAGNEGPGAETIGRPPDRATDEYRTCAVGAIDANNQNWPIASFSSRGPSHCTPDGSEAIKPEIVAPGVNVRSSIPDGGYGQSGSLFHFLTVADDPPTGATQHDHGAQPFPNHAHHQVIL
ncbi:MAG: S8 family serine peptidase [Planctomycetes bacterium]|nr:S8 family serine peptidase [Planctomycetota bacterium]